MKVSYLNDEFFSRLETLAVNLRTSLTGFFGGKHLVRSYGQTVEFADYREYMLGDDIRQHRLEFIRTSRSISLNCLRTKGRCTPGFFSTVPLLWGRKIPQRPPMPSR